MRHVWILLSLAFQMMVLRADSLEPGRLHPKVVCETDRQFSFALYLPKGYREDRVWPVMFCFAPDGDGAEPVRRFQAAADRFGVVLLGSNDSRNGSLRPALRAQEVMWEEAKRRFKMDPKCSFATGFSGGARMALRMALSHPGHFAGVASIGAFYPGTKVLTGGSGLAYALVAGFDDFLHFELMDAREDLTRRGWPVWAERYPGPHSWAPETVCTRALTFLVLQASKRGLMPIDPAKEADFLKEAKAHAKAREEEGELLEAARLWEDLVGLTNGEIREPCLKEVSRIKALPACAQERDAESKGRALQEELEAGRGRPDWQASLEKLAAQPRPTGAWGHSVARALNQEAALFHEVGFEAVRIKEWPKARRAFESMAILSQGNPMPLVMAAQCAGHVEDWEGALVLLTRAEAAGYREADFLESAPAFAKLKSDPRFQALLGRLRGTSKQ